MRSRKHIISVVWLVLGAISIGALTPRRVSAESETPLELFDRRIMPIFESEDPSSCVQCHLSSVDLKNYILPSSAATFASLREQGLIDVESPRQSKILTLIRMGEQDPDDRASLLHESTRDAEWVAFSKWIEACCKDPKLRTLTVPTRIAKPPVADEVIRHARKSRVVDSFVRKVWSQRMRCFPCHTPHEVDESNPRQQAAVKTRQALADKYDAAMLNRLAIFRATPEETMEYLIESSKSPPDGRLPMLDLARPTQSLFIQKPMSKLPAKRPDGTFEDPSYRSPLTHMGGLKLHPNDQGYKALVSWIQDYGRVVAGKYKTVAELPTDNWYPSQLVVRVKGAPDAWQVGGTVQLFIHEWSQQDKDWRDEPVAFTQGTVTPRRMVNGALFLLAGENDPRVAEWSEEPKLPKGRYLVKSYYDSNGKVEDDPTAILSTDDFFGQTEIRKPRWRKGFKHAELVPGKSLIPSE